MITNKINNKIIIKKMVNKMFKILKIKIKFQEL